MANKPNTDWILTDQDGTSYIGYQHGARKGVYMIASNNGSGGTRYYIGNINYAQTWADRASLTYKYYQDFLNDAGVFVNENGQVI